MRFPNHKKRVEDAFIKLYKKDSSIIEEILIEAANAPFVKKQESKYLISKDNYIKIKVCSQHFYEDHLDMWICNNKEEAFAGKYNYEEIMSFKNLAKIKIRNNISRFPKNDLDLTKIIN